MAALLVAVRAWTSPSPHPACSRIDESSGTTQLSSPSFSRRIAISCVDVESASLPAAGKNVGVMGVRGLPLDLRAFLLRGHCIRLYRAALRSARRAPAYSREELEHTIRQEFEVHRFEGNTQTIRFLLSDGLQRLKQLETLLGIQGHESDIRM